jgi:hypothetical protein
MLRIIDGTPYVGKASDSVRLRACDLGHGHLEVFGYKPIVWEEQDWDPLYLQDVLAVIASDRANRDEVEHQERMARKSAQRARKRIRQLCKVIGVDTLLTLTYRSCELDLVRCKADLKEFVRRLRRHVPGFCAVAGFERQQRGAWHVHLACRRFDRELSYKGARVKSYNVIRAVWRSVTGEREGTINVQSRKRNSQRSPARIASYISKYITKDYALGQKWTNRWTKFGDVALPTPIDLGLYPGMTEALVAAYGLMLPGQRVSNARVSQWGDSFFLFAESG